MDASAQEAGGPQRPERGARPAHGEAPRRPSVDQLSEWSFPASDPPPAWSWEVEGDPPAREPRRSGEDPDSRSGGSRGMNRTGEDAGGARE